MSRCDASWVATRSKRGLLSAFVLAALAVIVAGCGGDEAAPSSSGQTGFGPAPAAPGGELSTETEAAVDSLVDSALEGTLDEEALGSVASSKDPRLGWLLSDLLRFSQGGSDAEALVDAFGGLTGADVRDDPDFEVSPWQSVTDHLIAWDLPAPPGYRERKARIFLAVEPRWEPFFADADSAIDWRLLSWGGVLIDDRPLGDPEPCPESCIPALDDPALTDADGGEWYPGGETVFGVEVGGEAIAFPKNIMEVHEMVNITVGGRRLGIPYCTLCGSAQAYFTDSASGEPYVLRTSGLLSRSNKVMYDLDSRSVFDTFTGEALSGPLADRGVELQQTTVVTATWDEWKREHPRTRIVAEDGGIGRAYSPDPLGGRDDGGPIFPIGDADPRLPVQEKVVGVITPSGDAIAFPADAARDALEGGDGVKLGGIELMLDADGLRAFSGRGEVPAHEAFWFAWSQFHPETDLWEAR